MEKNDMRTIILVAITLVVILGGCAVYSFFQQFDNTIDRGECREAVEQFKNAPIQYEPVSNIEVAHDELAPISTVNAHQLVELQRIGRGWIREKIARDDGFYVLTSTSMWQIAPDNPDAPPQKLADYHFGKVLGTMVSPQHNLIAFQLAHPDSIPLMDVKTGDIKSASPADSGYYSYHYPAFTPDEDLFIAALGRLVYAWDTATGQVKWRLGAGDGMVEAIDVSQDGQYVRAQGWDYDEDSAHVDVTYVWNLETGELIPPDDELDANFDPVSTTENFPVDLVQYFPEPNVGRSMMFAGDDQLLQTDEIPFLQRDNELVVISGIPSFPSVVRVCDLDNGDQKRAFETLEGTHSVEFNTDHMLLAVNEWDTISLWDTDSYNKVGTVSPPNSWGDQIGGFAFHPFAPIIAFGYVHGETKDSTMQVWNFETNQKIAEVHGHAGSIIDMAFNDDGTLLASAGSDGTIRIWGIPAEQN